MYLNDVTNHSYAHHRLVGSDCAVLGPPHNIATGFAQRTRTRVPHGLGEQHTRRRHGQPPLPHLRHQEDGRAGADPGQQPEVHDACSGVYDRWTRYVSPSHVVGWFYHSRDCRLCDRVGRGPNSSGVL